MPTETIYEESLRGMHRLHGLIRDGLDHSDEAEHLREHLESLWWELTEEEQDRISELSIELNQSLT